MIRPLFCTKAVKTYYFERGLVMDKIQYFIEKCFGSTQGSTVLCPTTPGFNIVSNFDASPSYYQPPSSLYLFPEFLGRTTGDQDEEVLIERCLRHLRNLLFRDIINLASTVSLKAGSHANVTIPAIIPPLSTAKLLY